MKNLVLLLILLCARGTASFGVVPLPKASHKLGPEAESTALARHTPGNDMTASLGRRIAENPVENSLSTTAAAVKVPAGQLLADPSDQEARQSRKRLLPYISSAAALTGVTAALGGLYSLAQSGEVLPYALGIVAAVSLLSAIVKGAMGRRQPKRKLALSGMILSIIILGVALLVTGILVFVDFSGMFSFVF